MSASAGLNNLPTGIPVSRTDASTRSIPGTDLPTQGVRTFHISTFGCQMNAADSSTLATSLVTRGYRRVAEEADADLIILNTCSVREKAEERVYGRLGEVYRYKRENPDLRIAVVGCMAQRLGGDLRQKVPHVDYVLGTDRLFELPDLLEGKEGMLPIMTAFGHENMDMILPVQETPHSGFVTISRGCDNYCTYCIVPFVRGRERSHAPDTIVESVRRMAAQGVVEVTVLGQNVNSYRAAGTDFPDLLLRLARETGIRRIRYTTSHPKDCSKKLIHAMAAEPIIMPHVHLPLQSGSNRVLRKMGRFYTVEHYRKIIEYLRAQLPGVAITTDIIVGFPTETEAEFAETLRTVESIRYDSAFMFRYSVRPGTVAAREMTDDVPEETKVRRLNQLIGLQQRISYELNQELTGQITECFVEGVSRRDCAVRRGRTLQNKTVLIADAQIEIGSIVPVRITAADAYTLHGERVRPS